MRKESYEFLKAIQETPSPSGFEQPVQRIVRRHGAAAEGGMKSPQPQKSVIIVPMYQSGKKRTGIGSPTSMEQTGDAGSGPTRMFTSRSPLHECRTWRYTYS